MKKNSEDKSNLWFFSLHGGHSKDFCEHARGSLNAIINKAISINMSVYGITEHAPRTEYKYLYPEEIEAKLTPRDLLQRYIKYCKTTSDLQSKFQNSITILKGLEIEVVPLDKYVEITKNLIEEGNIEYIVGSVHWVDDIPFDFSVDEFKRASNKYGLVNLVRRYYEILRRMVSELRPQIVGHLDLITCFLSSEELNKIYPMIGKDIEDTLELIKKYDLLLEVNTSGYRKPIKRAFPDIYILKKAKEINIPLTFGDDSHSTQEVGKYIKRARNLLLKLGIKEVIQLNKTLDSKLFRQNVPII
ncbi:MAG: histidinol-phosphatase [Candidatus Hydrogenedentes bacterium]|nr:histidinol-phosphatase [Candidatus Hydrogenedentota bacterium]